MRNFILLLILSVPRLPACSCVAPDSGACGLAKNGGAIFTGRVTAEEKGEWVATYTFAVTEAFRGGNGVAAGLAVKVGTSAYGASCGASFKVGEEYLVYADMADGQYSTSLCSGNELAKDARAQLRFLRGTAQDVIAKGTPLPGFVFGFVTNRETDLRQFGEPSWPVEGANVKAVHATGGGFAAETRTADDGGYEFFNLPPGRYRIEVDPRGTFKGEADAPKSHEVRPGACVKRSFVRARRAVLDVRLVDSEGEPADSSTLHLEPLDGKQPRKNRPGEESELIAEDESEEGKYHFAVPPGRYRLAFKDLDLHYYPSELVLTEANPVILRYRLPKRPEQIVQAIVVDEAGRPIAGVKVRIRGRTPDDLQTSGSVVTPANGRIQFDELAPGDYELIAEAPGCPASVKVARGEQVEVKIACRER